MKFNAFISEYLRQNKESLEKKKDAIKVDKNVV